MKIHSSALISSSDLATLYINGEFIASTYVLIGGCAATGLTAFYSDNDGDGLGSALYGEYCAGFEPEVYLQTT